MVFRVYTAKDIHGDWRIVHHDSQKQKPESEGIHTSDYEKTSQEIDDFLAEHDSLHKKTMNCFSSKNTKKKPVWEDTNDS